MKSLNQIYALTMLLASGAAFAVCPPDDECPPPAPIENPVVLSPGNGTTDGDIYQFDRKYFTPSHNTWTLSHFEDDILKPFRLPGAGEIGDCMEAMILMYEATHDTRYLDHLRDVINLVLAFRDDRRPERPINAFRPARMTPMPAWGWKSPRTAMRHYTELNIAGVLGYPMAAFARMVAQDPTLHARYGNDALNYANAALETFIAIHPQYASRNGKGVGLTSKPDAPTWRREQPARARRL